MPINRLVTPPTTTTTTVSLLTLGSDAIGTQSHLAAFVVGSQHPNEDRPERPILLAVDQELGEGAALRVTPELADPVGPLEVREHEDVEQLGAWSRTESL